VVLLKAKAKINLFFHINGKREDGYHQIESLVVFAEDVYDTIEITPAELNSTSVIDGEFAQDLQNQQNNLIDKALLSFTEGVQYSCRLTKNIPIGAGLGGGSSDAAVVAKFLNKDQKNINNDLAEIGADLPICYLHTPAFCGGIGEIIEPIKNLPTLYLILVNPRKFLLTKDVFKNNQHISTPILLNKPIDFFSDMDKIIDFLEPLNNDLGAPAIDLMPEIKEILDLLKQQNGCCLQRLSGSGPTCFGIFTSKEQAEEACRNIRKLKPEYWVRFSKV
jgi:4-diphosphocytidyl-2-C-methyl-D-erythritol kinase